MGQGLPYPAPGMVPWANLFALPAWTADEAFRDVAVHWYLDGFQAPDAVEIPWTWISAPLRFRQDKPYTYAAVSKSGGGTAIESVTADEETEFTATLATRNDVDAPNLASFTTIYYDEPRTRLSELVVILNRRTDEEIWTILGVGIGTKVQLTGLPDGWPRGADVLVVEGIHHSSNVTVRQVTWAASPVVGEEPSAVGPFFRAGVSKLDGTDLLPW